MEETIKCSTNTITGLLNDKSFDIKFGSKYMFQKYERLHKEDYSKEREIIIDTDCSTGVICSIN